MLVIIGHSSCPMLLKKMIYGFHMPLFFLISGYLFNVLKWKHIGFRALVRAKAKMYLLPYFILIIPNLAVTGIIEFRAMGMEEGFMALIKRIFWSLYSYGNTTRMPNCTPLWFLPCIFIANIYFYYIISLHGLARKAVGVGICMVIDGLLYIYNVPQLPWHIDSALCGCVFMAAGYCIKKYNLLTAVKGYVVYIMCGLGLLAIFLNDPIDVNCNDLGNLFLFWSGALLVSFSFLYVCNRAFHKSYFFSYLGKNTILILGLNFLYNGITRVLWEYIPFLNKIQYTWYLKSILVTILLLLTIVIWDNIKIYRIKAA